MGKTNAKKLRLGRETVAVLQSVELTDINGGVVYTGCVSGCTRCPGDNLTIPQGPQGPKGPQVGSWFGCPPPGTDLFTGKPPVR